MNHSTAANPLHITASGNDGGMADRINIQTNSQHSVIFDSLISDFADINADVDNLSLYNVRIGSRAVSQNSLYDVVVDNINKNLQAYDAQLYAPSDPFYLIFSAQKKFLTNAFVVNYDDDFIINAYSSDNSILRLMNRAQSLLLKSPGSEVRSGEAVNTLNDQKWIEEFFNSAPIVFLSNYLRIEDEKVINDEAELEVVR